ncbi:50S ribosomal protein L20 [Candidatus Falkowbacteria bacterium]|uniref:Large ribosomal subunit protein bL20 n=1 Tax=Candidatus Falkowbacteria bacterium CG10_big_fil_rev_8_21_14_0_10_37_18 TaxID=1974562 RepID=A0A2H0V8M0_9BACT|nr:50S ribosomal protein L20 [Candidatus Falkowbacteria bacterium]NCQ12924.1 50S ribosomal protein L20 [Candidatus Falkowbacteria bacterium]OIO06268.1 MAG: 50S ribosomal protein L20 [Candidatus Falkowbacteria bacterium CG1_02_37_21]PIR95428.1 MAG: 50S ribosomal protein L20 [Candidatus Falkowbacteria bacterium CG10_big_fil_rev_8_21_14_0_10_37_18]
MPRVKRGMSHVKKRKKLLKDVKGYKWGRKNLIRLAKTARTKAGAHAFVDRRKKKRVMRGLWQIKINAFVREQGLSYSRFIDVLKKNNVDVDRKILADLAVNNKETLVSLITQLKK